MAEIPPHLADVTVPHDAPDGRTRALVEDGVFWVGRLIADDGGTTFELWSNYDPEDPAGAPVHVVIEARRAADAIVVFDAAQHGYDANLAEAVEDAAPPLRLVRRGVEVLVVAGYSIEWEDEKEDWVDAEDGDTVTLVNGTQVTWAEAKAIGFDWIDVFVREPHGEWTEFGGFELA